MGNNVTQNLLKAVIENTIKLNNADGIYEEIVKNILDNFNVSIKGHFDCTYK